MRNFSYLSADDPWQAASLLRNGDARIIAGGTELLPLMKDDLASPDTLVDISRWREGREIKATDQGIEIGALATLSEVASHPVIRDKYTALADSCRLSAAPQLRNMGTLGGNLLQVPRCWYYRGPFNCWLKGGERCFARGGENELHAIFNTEPERSVCVSVHPSDPAVALLALEATVQYYTPEGAMEVPIGKFYRFPTPDRRTMIDIPESAIITSMRLPAFTGKSLYRKAMSRATWTFALAGLALAMQFDGDTIVEARVALGGVAVTPIRVASVEERLRGTSISSISRDELSALMVEDARPLSQNGYKVSLLQGLFSEAWPELVSGR